MKKIEYKGSFINAIEKADVDKLLEKEKITMGGWFFIPGEIDGVKVEGLASGCMNGITGAKVSMFPKNLIYVQSKAIINCDFEELVFWPSLECFEFDDLRSNKHLDCISVLEGCNSYKTIKRNLYNADGSVLLYGFNKIIDESTVRIGEKAFMDSNIESVVFPENVISVGIGAFLRCEKLQTVKFSGDKLAWIGTSAFEDCKSLKRIAIPKNVNVIDSSAFKDSGLFELMFEDRNVDSLGLTINSKAFMGTKLKAVDFLKVNDIFVEAEAFKGTDVKSISLTGEFYLKSRAFSRCSIERINLKLISAAAPILISPRDALGNHTDELIELISRHAGEKDEITYIRHNNAWVEDIYW